jgi:hypothetical protein
VPPPSDAIAWYNANAASAAARFSLAEYVDSLQGQTPVTEISGTSPFALTTLWDCLDVKPADVPKISTRRRIFE